MRTLPTQALLTAITLACALSFTQPLHAVVIGTTEVPLDGRLESVRSVETNLGNLSADAFFSQAVSGGQNPDIAVSNGGGIRNNSILPAGDIDETFPFDVHRFGNEIGTINVVTMPTFLGVLENAVSRVGTTFGGTGRFLQVSDGFSFTWNPAAPAGNRIIDALLFGVPLIDDGIIVSSRTLNIATNKFLADGGDDYFWGGAVFTSTGVIDNVALTNFIINQGVITAAAYPVGGEGRIRRVPEPTTLALFGLALAGLFVRGRLISTCT